MMKFAGVAEERQTKVDPLPTVGIVRSFRQVTFFATGRQAMYEGNAAHIEKITLKQIRRK